MKTLIHLLILFLISSGTIASADSTPVDAALKAYADGDYSKAFKIAQRLDSPKAKLVVALVKLFSERYQDIGMGLSGLKKLIDDSKTPPGVWRQAALTYARTVQLMQRRKGLYSAADNMDFSKIYLELLKKFPESPESCRAMVYLTEDRLASKTPATVNETFDMIENYCKNFKGNRKLLVPVYLFAANEYIYRKQDYKAAAECMNKAYKIGIMSPRLKEGMLFRLARTFDLKLHNRKQAEKYYREFLKEYPQSSRIPAVKRYLRALQDDKGGRK